MNIADKLQTVAENVPKVYDAGKQTQHNDFWDKYLDEDVAITSIYNYNKFSGAGWKDDTFCPTKDLKVGYGKQWFYYSRITNIKQKLIDCGVKFDFSNASDLGAFYEGSTTTEVPEIDLTAIKGGTQAQRLFYGCQRLVTIDKIKTKDIIVYGNDFVSCTALENLLWEGSIGNPLDIKQSAKLTTKSIVSTVEHLNNGITGQTLSLSQTAVGNMVFPFTSEQSGSTYNSWDELIGTKANWTITLV